MGAYFTNFFLFVFILTAIKRNLVTLKIHYQFDEAKRVQIKTIIDIL